MEKISESNYIRDFVNINVLSSELIKLAKSLKINEFYELTLKELPKYLDNYLRNDLICHIEFPYVDKMYRDTYYHFHSTKRLSNNKDCLRIAFFEDTINQDAFYSNNIEEIKQLRDKFVGYIILRPTKIRKIGRTFLSKKALKRNDFQTCLTFSKVLIRGVEFSVEGFPHAGQDGEAHRCSEVCIWETMEYFSKYQEFASILPSQITKIADDLNFQRALPTDGLLFPQMAYTLKKLGFGVKAYDRDYMNEETFNKTFNDYIESGIPILTIIRNDEDVRHSVLAIGHVNVEKLTPKQEVFEANKANRNDGIRIIDSTRVFEKEYIFIDDNLPPYQFANLKSPLAHYEKPKNAQIISIIVPLQSKIYVDSPRVRAIFNQLMELEKIQELISTEIDPVLISRFLLTSTRSFKRTVCGNTNFDLSIKKLIESLSLPKFLWLIELSTVSKYLENKVLGFIIIDATGTNHIDSVVSVVWRNKIWIRTSDGFFREDQVVNQEYPIFVGNLK